MTYILAFIGLNGFADLNFTQRFYCQKTDVPDEIREDFVRADIEETGAITFPVGGFDLYVDGFLKSVDAKAIASRNYNILLDYSYGSASVIFPFTSIEKRSICAPFGTGKR